MGLVHTCFDLGFGASGASAFGGAGAGTYGAGSAARAAAAASPLTATLGLSDHASLATASSASPSGSGFFDSASATAASRAVAAATLARAFAGTTLARVFASAPDDPWQLQVAALVDTIVALRTRSRANPLGSAPVQLFLARLDAQSTDVRRLAWGLELGVPSNALREGLVTPWT